MMTVTNRTEAQPEAQTSAAMEAVLDLIRKERTRQNEKWGFPQCNSRIEWGVILAEEFGEAMKEINECHFRNADDASLKTELVQLAAVAVSIIEHLGMQRLDRTSTMAISAATGDWVQTCGACGFTVQGTRRLAHYCPNCGCALLHD